jgi:hypothetical protein
MPTSINLAIKANYADIADAIRKKTGTYAPIYPPEMPTAIDNIPSAIENVQVAPLYATENNKVYHPSEYNTSFFTDVTVQVPMVEKTITSNGTYNANLEGAQGYSQVTVNVPTGGAMPAIQGSLQEKFMNNSGNFFVTYAKANNIDFNSITSLQSAFENSDLLTTFDNLTISCVPDAAEDSNRMLNCFKGCNTLTELPIIRNCKPSSLGSLFFDCHMLRDIPSDFTNTWDFSRHTNNQSAWGAVGYTSMFANCYSLRYYPPSLLENLTTFIGAGNNIFNGGFQNCYSLDEITGLPTGNPNYQWNNNGFRPTGFQNCTRVKSIKFKTNPDGTATTARWKKQAIDLSQLVGWGDGTTIEIMLNSNSGITSDKLVTGTTYEDLKNDPDWYTYDEAYSRYNKTSALETINTLPDTSAYLAEVGDGSVNTITFRGPAGQYTDGGAISTLTTEEIAIAAAKGWTVTYV